jgi:hypothetical protein
MQHFEVHFIETEEDVDLGLQSGMLTVEQLDNTSCNECGAHVGHASGVFESFAIVIDIDDDDWALCSECSGPVTYGARFTADESLEFLSEVETLNEDDLEPF